MHKRMACYVRLIEEKLTSCLTEDEAADNRTLIRAMKYSLLNAGKRIRPVMTLGFCELSGADPRKALPFACAVEMIHTYSLIHDDLPCMDNDTIRRGKPTSHMVFGEGMAVLAGDALLTLAFETAMEAAGSGVSAENTITAARLLAKLAGSEGMVGGQCIDIESEGREISLATLEKMDMGKTVALISAACRMGCIAANASEAEIQAAQAYAVGVGMSFQIRDDILGLIGDEAVLGKSVGIDSVDEKSNYVSRYGVDKAQQIAEDYTAQAIAALQVFPASDSFMKELAVSMAKRSY